MVGRSRRQGAIDERSAAGGGEGDDEARFKGDESSLGRVA